MSFRSSSIESDGINEPEPLPEDPVEIAKKQREEEKKRIKGYQKPTFIHQKNNYKLQIKSFKKKFNLNAYSPRNLPIIATSPQI